ncbi:hypothetical protein [Candidatus Poriferisocius sp.]|uniref:hypothetical protein n=1 Tax=Candidatus Poriferisocius sp. TaxID=3101276 RepID=UPI003B02AFA2
MEFPQMVTADGAFDTASVNEAFQAWFRSDQSSCVFAHKMSKNVHLSDWHQLCVPAPLDDAGLHKKLAEAVSGRHKATQITFPYADSVESISELIQQVARADDWHANRIDVHNGIVHIGLRWSGVGEELVAWVLGFAPLNTMPVTRRAPFTALIFRSQDGYAKPRKENSPDPETEVHLADICVAGTENTPIWTTTQDQRAALVEPTLEGGARAQVSFSLPVGALPTDFGVLR